MTLLNQPAELRLLIASFVSSYNDLNNLTKTQNAVPGTFRRALQAGARIHGSDATTLLHQAAEADCAEILQLLIDNGALIDAQSEDQSTALHTALRSWSWGAAEFLLQAGAAPNAADDQNSRPLHLSAVIIPVPLVEMALHYGADPIAQNGQGWSCAAMHAFHGRAATLAVLFDAGANVNDQTSGETLLALAAVSGKRDAFQLLLDRGADKFIRTSERSTVFHICVQKEKFDLAEILLDHGVDVDSSDGDGVTALYAAIRRRSQKQTEFLLAHGASLSTRCRGQTPLQCAVDMGCCEIVTLLLDKGADMTVYDEAYQRPLLCFAARQGHAEVVQPLLTRGASAYFTDSSGRTMLQFAAEANSPAVFKHLLQSGTDVDKGCCDGCLPLYQAVWHGNFEIVQLLVEHGANVNNGGNGTWSPIKQAVAGGNLPILEYLVQNGANAETDAVGIKTSLTMIASLRGRIDIIRWLLANTKLDAGDVDAFGRTALHYAARVGKTPVVEFWASNYPKTLRARDLTGATPFMLAARNDQTSVAQYFCRATGCDVFMDRDNGNHSAIYWAKKCRGHQTAELLSNHFLECHVALPHDAFAEDDDNGQVDINVKSCFCDICGCHSTSKPNVDAFECHACCQGSQSVVLICGRCARDRGRCLGEGHTWQKHVCECVKEEDEAVESESDETERGWSTDDAGFDNVVEDDEEDEEEEEEENGSEGDQSTEEEESN